MSSAQPGTWQRVAAQEPLSRQALASAEGCVLPRRRCSAFHRRSTQESEPQGPQSIHRPQPAPGGADAASVARLSQGRPARDWVSAGGVWLRLPSLMDSSVVKWLDLQRLRLSSVLWRGIPPEQRWGSILDGLAKTEDQIQKRAPGSAAWPEAPGDRSFCRASAQCDRCVVTPEHTVVNAPVVVCPDRLGKFEDAPTEIVQRDLGGHR